MVIAMACYGGEGCWCWWDAWGGAGEGGVVIEKKRHDKRKETHQAARGCHLAAIPRCRARCVPQRALCSTAGALSSFFLPLAARRRGLRLTRGCCLFTRCSLSFNLCHSVDVRGGCCGFSLSLLAVMRRAERRRVYHWHCECVLVGQKYIKKKEIKHT